MKPPFFKGSSPDIMSQNMKSFKKKGMSELEATKSVIKASKSSGHSKRASNLKGFLHPKGKGKALKAKVDKPEYSGDAKD